MSGGQKLRYMSASTSRDLKRDVGSNYERYLNGDFLDLAEAADWSIPLSFEPDLSCLSGLSQTADSDAESSILVWKALRDMPPSLAVEGRIWTRMAHVEGLAYARARWIGSKTGADAEKAIQTHFFADTRTGCRDDNALGRLWWTAYIAHLADPVNHEAAIRAIWRTADIRSNIIERPWTSSRPRIVGGIVRAILLDARVTKSEAAFREFMKALNATGGGLVFEEMSESSIDMLIAGCAPS